ncbi:glycosyltransferase, partial [Helicobacter typhlonius]
MKMSEKFPLVSIITIVYNDKNHIKETMDSVVGQDYERLEYIIIDGNSKDGT